MTAEVVVMNRVGVALAADSAGTVEVGDTSKVRDSALKVFMLSKHCPVGVMVYESSSLLGVPWETIIKLFRRKLGRKTLDQLENYGDALMEFLDSNTALFPAEVQDRYYLRALDREYRRIEKAARDELKDRALYAIGGRERDDRMEARELAEEAIEEALEEWRKIPAADYFDTVSGAAVAGRKSAEVSEHIHEVFVDWQPGSAAVEKLREIAEHVVDKDEFPSGVFSGIVIAGFGEADHFPSVQHIELGGVYDGRLKARRAQVEKISQANPSQVMSFAYTEMVENFLYGVSEEVFERFGDAALFIQEMPVLALEAVPGLSDEDRREVEKVVRRASKRMAAEFERSVVEGPAVRRDEIATAVEALTIKELGEAASTLVSMSSFQQQMSLGRETVGGPVDVAVISKGDGFVWIDRKHYFPRGPNAHFFRNYFDYGDADDGVVRKVDDEEDQ